MTVTFIPGKSGNYQCLSTDMSGSLPVDDMSWIGANVFVTDTGEWYRVDENLYLVPMTYPISGSISAIVNGSDIQIGAVEIKDADTDLRVKVIQGSSITVDDYAMAVHDAGTISASLVVGGSAIWVNDGNVTIDGGTVDTVTAITDITNTVSGSLVAGGSTVAIEDKNITSYGFISSLNTGSLTPFMKTTSASQVINFTDTTGNSVEVNALTIYSSVSPLYIKINSGSHCLYVPATSDISLDGQVITEMTILNGSDTSLRYYAQYK